MEIQYLFPYCHVYVHCSFLYFRLYARALIQFDGVEELPGESFVFLQQLLPVSVEDEVVQLFEGSGAGPRVRAQDLDLLHHPVQVFLLEEHLEPQVVHQARQVVLLVQMLFHFFGHGLSGPGLAFYCSVATRQGRYVKLVDDELLADQRGKGPKDYETTHGALEPHRHLTSPVLLELLRVHVPLDDFSKSQSVEFPVGDGLGLLDLLVGLEHQGQRVDALFDLVSLFLVLNVLFEFPVHVLDFEPLGHKIEALVPPNLLLLEVDDQVLDLLLGSREHADVVVDLRNAVHL